MNILDYSLSEIPKTQKLVSAKRERIPLLPVFEEKGQYFRVTLRTKHQMTFHLEEIYRTLRLKGPLSSSAISKEIDIHQNTAIKRLKELIDLRSVEKTGSGKNTKYRVKE